MSEYKWNRKAKPVPLKLGWYDFERAVDILCEIAVGKRPHYKEYEELEPVDCKAMGSFKRLVASKTQNLKIKPI